MTYAIGRPLWARYTGIRSTRGVIHIASGWSAFDGTRTKCGRTLKQDGDFFHLIDATAVEVGRVFETGTPCGACLRTVANEKAKANA